MKIDSWFEILWNIIFLKNIRGVWTFKKIRGLKYSDFYKSERPKVFGSPCPKIEKSKFKMADPIWPIKMFKLVGFLLKFVSQGCWGRYIQTRKKNQNSKWRIQYGGWKFLNGWIFIKKSILRFLRLLYLNTEEKIKNTKWRTQYGGSKIFIIFWFLWKLVFWDFWSPWIHIWQNFIIQNGGSNMAAWTFLNGRIFIKMDVWGFLGTLNKNIFTEFQNTKWRIQYDGSTFFKLLDFYEN